MAPELQTPILEAERIIERGHSRNIAQISADVGLGSFDAPQKVLIKRLCALSVPSRFGLDGLRLDYSEGC